MSSTSIVVNQPVVQITLNLFNGFIDLLPQCWLIKLLQYRLMEAFTDPVRLGMSGFCFGVLNLIDGDIQLVIMAVGPATVFRSPIRQDAQYREFFSHIKWQHPVIQKVGSSNRSLGGVQLAMGHFGVGIHISLLIDPANPLESTDIEGVL